MDKDIKIEKGFTFITEAGNLPIITKVFKNGTIYAYEFTGTGVEEVEYTYDENDRLLGKDSHIVYGVVGNDKKILENQTSFYFNKDYARSATQQMNRHIAEKKKPYRVKKYYLLDFNQSN